MFFFVLFRTNFWTKVPCKNFWRQPLCSLKRANGARITSVKMLSSAWISGSNKKEIWERKSWRKEVSETENKRKNIENGDFLFLTAKLSMTRRCSWSPNRFRSCSVQISLLGRESIVALRRQRTEFSPLINNGFERRKFIKPRRSAERKMNFSFFFTLTILPIKVIVWRHRSTRSRWTEFNQLPTDKFDKWECKLINVVFRFCGNRKITNISQFFRFHFNSIEQQKKPQENKVQLQIIVSSHAAEKFKYRDLPWFHRYLTSVKWRKRAEIQRKVFFDAKLLVELKRDFFRTVFFLHFDRMIYLLED